jgi:hypothetical protein
MGFSFKRFFKKIAPVILVAAMIVNPGIAMSVGTSMGFSGAAAAAAGAATIQTGVSLAMGATPEQAIKAGAIAGITAGVGSEVAGATGSNVVGGATGSAVGTVAAGGSAQDVLKNAAAGGIANGLADAGSASAGKAAGTLIATGGDTNAAIKAAVTTELIQAGQQGYASYSSTKTAELDKMNQVDTTTSPEQQAAAGVQQLIDTAKSQPGTQLAQADTGITSDVQAPLLTGVPGQTEGGGVVVEAKYEPQPAFDPTLTFTGATQPKSPSAPAPAQTRDQQMVDLIKPTESADTTQPAPSAPSEAAPTEGKAAEQPASKKTPSPITYTGVTPLTQTLGTSFSGVPTTGTTTGLTGERGAGEIESKETGKNRQNVWNEASLRLKDALGV